MHLTNILRAWSCFCLDLGVLDTLDKDVMRLHWIALTQYKKPQMTIFLLLRNAYIICLFHLRCFLAFTFHASQTNKQKRNELD